MPANILDMYRYTLQKYKDRGMTHVLLTKHGMNDKPCFLPVKKGESIYERVDRVRRIGELVMEIYNLTLPIDDQLQERMSWHP